jgi:hypothetical protein
MDSSHRLDQELADGSVELCPEQSLARTLSCLDASLLA